MSNLNLETPQPKTDTFCPERFIALDTETTGLNVWKGDRPFALSLCDEWLNTHYYSWPVDPSTREVFAPHDVVQDIQNKLDSVPELVLHNASFDLGMLSAIGVKTHHRIHDTYIMARIANNLEISLRLKTLADKYLSIDNSDEEDLKEATRAARDKAKLINNKTGEEGYALSAANAIEQDYWLVQWFDKDNTLCEKYCRLDTVRTMGLFRMYWNILEADPSLKKDYFFEMFEVWPIVQGMVQLGISVSPEAVARERARAVTASSHYMQVMLDMIDEQGLRPFADGQDGAFNPASSQQLRRILFGAPEEGGLGLTGVYKSAKTQQLTTGADNLRMLTNEPFVRALEQKKAADKVTTAFFDNFLLRMVREGNLWILHPGFDQAGAKTGRFSCREPNLQNIGNPDSTRSAASKAYSPRTCFLPRPGCVWYGADFGQQELRIFAEISHNEWILSAIANGLDPNGMIANRVWGGEDNEYAGPNAARSLRFDLEDPGSEEVTAVWEDLGWSPDKSKTLGAHSLEAIALATEWLSRFDYDIVEAEKSLGSKNTRNLAKTVIFLKIYGGGVKKLQRNLNCSQKTAVGIMEGFDRSMPEIQQFSRAWIKQAQRDGYVYTPYGKRLNIVYDLAYKIVNHTVQSTAATMLKKAMVRIARHIQDNGLQTRIVLAIHDELIFEIPFEEESMDLIKTFANLMVDTDGCLQVPMTVEFKRYEESWGQSTKVEL